MICGLGLGKSFTARASVCGAQARASASASRMASTSGTVPSASSVVDFMQLLQNLKTTPRTGWVRHGVDEPESIADHMYDHTTYRMSVLALLMQGSEYDHVRCIKLAIVHDIAEAIVGDIVPEHATNRQPGDASDADKHRQEAAAIARIKAMVGEGSAAGHEIEALWYEYEECSSKEAELVKDFDKLEMILQAAEYETAQGITLQDFFDSTAGKWRTEFGRSLAEEIVKRRPNTQAPPPR